MRCPECDKEDLEEIKIDVDGDFSFAEHFSYCPVYGIYLFRINKVIYG